MPKQFVCTTPPAAATPVTRITLRRLACLVAIAIASPIPVSAQNLTEQFDLAALPIEQLLTLEVYSASKFVQKVSDAPSAVSVVTASDIKAFGWRTLADILRSMRGLYVNNDRNYSYLGARGFLRPGDYNTRFLLLVDGNRTNDAVFDTAAIGSEFVLDVDMIERVEFVPGPGSSIYGANAFFGVINIITKRGRDLGGAHAPCLVLALGQHRSGDRHDQGAPGGARVLRRRRGARPRRGRFDL